MKLIATSLLSIATAVGLFTLMVDRIPKTSISKSVETETKVIEHSAPVVLKQNKTVKAQHHNKENPHHHLLAVNIAKHYKHIHHQEAKTLVKYVYKEATSKSIDPLLVLGLIAAESSFKKKIVSPMGAVGYTQVMPRWHSDKIKNRDITHTHVNVQVGVKILSDCFKRKRSERAALACYNGASNPKDAERYVQAVYKHVTKMKRFVA